MPSDSPRFITLNALDNSTLAGAFDKIDALFFFEEHRFIYRMKRQFKLCLCVMFIKELLFNTKN